MTRENAKTGMGSSGYPMQQQCQQSNAPMTRDEPTVDDQGTFPGASRVKSTGSLDLTFLADEACVSINIQKIVGIY